MYKAKNDTDTPSLFCAGPTSADLGALCKFSTKWRNLPAVLACCRLSQSRRVLGFFTSFRVMSEAGRKSRNVLRPFRWQRNWICRGVKRPENPVTCFPPGRRGPRSGAGVDERISRHDTLCCPDCRKAAFCGEISRLRFTGSMNHVIHNDK